MINRAQLRGKPLDKDCKRAHTWPVGNKNGCFGIIDLMTDELFEECAQCGALIGNIEHRESVKE